MKNPHRALEAIECLVGSDFGMDMEWFLYSKEKKKDKRLIEAAKIITKVYQIAHSEVAHACHHDDWENIKYKILEDYNRNENVKPKKLKRKK